MHIFISFYIMSFLIRIPSLPSSSSSFLLSFIPSLLPFSFFLLFPPFIPHIFCLFPSSFLSSLPRIPLSFLLPLLSSFPHSLLSFLPPVIESLLAGLRSYYCSINRDHPRRNPGLNLARLCRRKVPYLTCCTISLKLFCSFCLLAIQQNLLDVRGNMKR